MVFNTLTVGAAVTPSVIETYFSHYLNRAPLRQKPTAHISYHEGLKLIRQFLDYSSKHTIEDIQAFTGQWVPCPTWVRINDAEVAPKFLDRAAQLIRDQLGWRGLEQIGGKSWWLWRRPEQPLRAEWIEMKKEYYERKRTGEKCERVILYVHGGAYYFGSVYEHRYQMQRHARKLKARVLSPRYRLAPQFPFPCGLYDCLATYFYLLEHFDPAQIIFAGDSAGGGMVLSMLCALRDQGHPLPAGTILISPWVDLTHSFPSVAGDGAGDYIPPHGFHHRPSMAWPPPPSSGGKTASGSYGAPMDAVELPATAGLDMRRRKKSRPDIEDDKDDDESVLPAPSKDGQSVRAVPIVAFGQPLSVDVDGKPVELKEQIQMYTTNELLAHPLVSPVLQPSLGGLPPMLIQVGGAELLKDEQIYLAHKAANPKAFPPNQTIMREFDPDRRTLNKYPPTDVQLQLWEDLCHVTPTLSFTRPAKYMYRSIAQFGAWALAHAQQKSIDIQNDDAVSVISSASGDAVNDDDSKSTAGSTSNETNGDAKEDAAMAESRLAAIGAVGKAGDPIPPFKDHMIRQRVSRHGVVFPLTPASEMECLTLDPATIGVPKTGPVKKWLTARASQDQKFANETKKVLKKRAKEVAAGYDEIPGESPPPTALVNRRRKGMAPEEKKRGKSWGLAMWSGWGSSHDEHTLEREQKNEKAATELTRKQSALQGQDEGSGSNSNLTLPTRRTSNASKVSSQAPWSRNRERPRSPYTAIRDKGQVDEGSPAPSAARSPLATDNTTDILLTRPTSLSASSPIPVIHDSPPVVPTTGSIAPDSEKIPGSENTFLAPSGSRPHNGMQAYPFKLRDAQHQANASTATLDSQIRGATGGISTPASGAAHSELAGDSPAPVELPSVADSSDTSGVSTPATRSVERFTALPTSAPASTAVSPSDEHPLPDLEIPQLLHLGDSADAPVIMDKTNSSKDSEAQKSSSTMPFKMRSAIFDPRTSMLGSIGADGMPNAHHDFPVRSNSNLTVPTVAATDAVSPLEKETQKESSKPEGPKPDVVKESREPGKPNEATKAAPFKMRHTVYDPNTTFKKDAASADPAAPPMPGKQEGSAGHEAGKSSVSSGEPTPVDVPSPLTHPLAPEPLNLSSRPSPSPREKVEGDVVKESGGGPSTSIAASTMTKPASSTPTTTNYNDERPPTPPPKDDKPYITLNKKRSGGLITTNGIKMAGTRTSAPMIGELGFEKG